MFQDGKFDLLDFSFGYDDGVTKVFYFKDIKVIFEKSWFGLMDDETRGEILLGDSEPLEKMYHNLSPHINVRTTTDKQININIVNYTLKNSNRVYNEINIRNCAIIYTGLVALS
jgi:hypothetical protein